MISSLNNFQSATDDSAERAFLPMQESHGHETKSRNMSVQLPEGRLSSALGTFFEASMISNDNNTQVPETNHINDIDNDNTIRNSNFESIMKETNWDNLQPQQEQEKENALHEEQDLTTDSLMSEMYKPEGEQQGQETLPEDFTHHALEPHVSQDQMRHMISSASSMTEEPCKHQEAALLNYILPAEPSLSSSSSASASASPLSQSGKHPSPDEEQVTQRSYDMNGQHSSSRMTQINALLSLFDNSSAPHTSQSLETNDDFLDLEELLEQSVHETQMQWQTQQQQLHPGFWQMDSFRPVSNDSYPMCEMPRQTNAASPEVLSQGSTLCNSDMLEMDTKPILHSCPPGIAKSKKTRRRNHSQMRTGHLQCENCNSIDTPMWRRGGTTGQQILCNRCGLYYARKGKHRPPLSKRADAKTRVNGVTMSSSSSATPNSRLSIPLQEPISPSLLSTEVTPTSTSSTTLEDEYRMTFDSGNACQSMKRRRRRSTVKLTLTPKQAAVLLTATQAFTLENHIEMWKQLQSLHDAAVKKESNSNLPM